MEVMERNKSVIHRLESRNFQTSAIPNKCKDLCSSNRRFSLSSKRNSILQPIWTPSTLILLPTYRSIPLIKGAKICFLIPLFGFPLSWTMEALNCPSKSITQLLTTRPNWMRCWLNLNSRYNWRAMWYSRLLTHLLHMLCLKLMAQMNDNNLSLL